MNYLKELKLNVKFDEFLKNYTTFGIGGRADVLVSPRNIKELEFLIKALVKNRERFFILGRGSNLLVHDEGFRGTVITLRAGEFLLIEGEPENLKVGAGVELAGLLDWCRKEGFSGLEFMAGIPASVGGAIWQNAGMGKKTIAGVIKDITYLDKEGEKRTLKAAESKFSYRRLDLELSVITGATLKLKKSTPEAVEKNILFFLDLKKQRQPIEKRSAGCVFKNPKNKNAGVLIEEVGLKGTSYGGACISEKHANFIINGGNATYQDVLHLINLIRREVRLKKDVCLETEIEILQ